ncbi:MAG TPA: hypothetical protein VLM79_36200, partial [Kofleriaceae bacterium]|nr:hypothetical protein [Kofleriaceae bacterium]
MAARAPRPLGTAATILALGLTAWLAVPAHADELDGARVIFVRGSTLFQVDARGKAETEIAQLAAKVTVRALRTDAQGQVLLADLAGKWAWMPLDGTARSLADLPCADGPAQLAEDGSSVLCRSPSDAYRSIIVDLARGRGAKPGKTLAVDVPPGGARIAGDGAERRVVWADDTGVWAAAPTDLKSRSRVALDSPMRGFLASPDGSHAIGVYADEIYADVKRTRPAEVLMTVQLDGQGARRKAIRDGVILCGGGELEEQRDVARQADAAAEERREQRPHARRRADR